MLIEDQKRLHRMKMLKTQLFLMFTLFTVTLTAAELGSIELCRRQTGVAIVTAEEPTPTALFAAKELKNALKKTLDIDAAIYSENEQPANVSYRFLVGPAKSNPLPAGLTYDHFIIRTLNGQMLQLAGCDDSRNPLASYYLARTGTLYAVYHFMHDNLGIRMLWPGEGGITYPRLDSVRLGNIDFSDGPKLPIRSSYYGSGNRYSEVSLQAAVRWGRFNGLGCTKLGIFNHASAGAVGTELFKTHPEYYALVNGVRKAPPVNGRARWKLCHSNPDLPGLFADWGIKHPVYEDFFPADANDGVNWCECAACKGLDGGQISRFTNRGEELCVSGRMFTLANRIAAELHRRHSTKEVAMFAYGFYADPPEHIAKLEDNVLIAVAKGISWCNVLADAASFNKLMKLWNRKTENLVLRDYPGNGRGMVVYPYPHLAARAIKNLHHMFKNFQGITNCGDDQRAYALWGPTQYVYAHLLWNPEEPLETILNEYYTAGWPLSQKYIRAYYDYFEKRSAEIKKNGGNSFPTNLLDAVAMMSPEAISHGKQLLDQAVKAARGSSGELARVEFIRVGLEAADIDCEYHRMLIRAGAIPGIYQTDQTVDKKTLLEKAMKAIEQRKAFMTRYRNHEGIPSEPFDKNGTNISWEQNAKNLYDACRRQPPADQISLLDGWKFSVDSPGLMEQFSAPDFDASKWVPITTDRSWEEHGFGADKYPIARGYNGWGFYRRSIEVPANWTNGRIILVLGAVDESYRLFCDGKLVAEYTYDAKKDPHGWSRERRFDLTKVLSPGQQHLIAVAVHDSAGAGGIWRPASLNLELPPNLLTGDYLSDVINASRQGRTLTLKPGAQTIRFAGLVRWCSPGEYLVRLRFAGRCNRYYSEMPVRLLANIRINKSEWVQAASTGITQNDLCPDSEQTLELTVTVPPGGDINAIVELSVDRIDIESLEITALK